MRDRTIVLISAAFLAVLCVFPAKIFQGDTIIKKDMEKVKGVVVEEYKDRVVISTTEGEKEIMREDIDKIDYALEEQNLTNMGNRYQDKGMYQDAHYYYEQALIVNPNYKNAKEGLNYSENLMQQMSRKMKTTHMRKMEMERDWRMGTLGDDESMANSLRETLGFSVEPKGSSFEVTDVQIASPGWKAGLRKGDNIVAVWGRLVGYILPEELMKKILAPEVVEIRITIVRKKDLKVKDVKGKTAALIGAQLTYSEIEGFEIGNIVPGGESGLAGVMNGDVLVSVDGVSTRYMSMEELEKIFSDKKGSSVAVGLKRDLSMWKTLSKI